MRAALAILAGEGALFLVAWLLARHLDRHRPAMTFEELFEWHLVEEVYGPTFLERFDRTAFGPMAPVPLEELRFVVVRDEWSTDRYPPRRIVREARPLEPVR